MRTHTKQILSHSAQEKCAAYIYVVVIKVLKVPNCSYANNGDEKREDLGFSSYERNIYISRKFPRLFFSDQIKQENYI